jgi:GAF domain-containing protein
MATRSQDPEGLIHSSQAPTWGLNHSLRPATEPSREIRRIEDDFLALLANKGMCQALALLNARTRFRYTGIYRVEPPLLRNTYLFDRENPLLSLGGCTAPINQTYCGIVASTQSPFVSVDARRDARVSAHPAAHSIVSYAGVPIRKADGRVFATLCHFDLRPRILPAAELAVLESIANLVARWFVSAATNDS